MDGFERLAAWSFWHTIFATRSSSAHSNYTIYRMKTKTPNKAVEPTTIHVTVCAYAQPAPCMVAAHF